MKALLLSLFTVTAVFAVVLLTMVATGERFVIVAMVLKMPLMQVVFLLCVVAVWFVFRAIGREIRRQG